MLERDGDFDTAFLPMHHSSYCRFFFLGVSNFKDIESEKLKIYLIHFDLLSSNY